MLAGWCQGGERDAHSSHTRVHVCPAVNGHRESVSGCVLTFPGGGLPSAVAGTSKSNNTLRSRNSPLTKREKASIAVNSEWFWW